MCKLELVLETIREKNLRPDQEVLPAPGIGATENLVVEQEVLLAPGTGMTKNLGVELDLVKDFRDVYPVVRSAPNLTEEAEMR